MSYIYEPIKTAQNLTWLTFSIKAQILFVSASFPHNNDQSGIKMSAPQVNGLNGGHYQEINHHYAEECSQDDIGTFLFTSESVGEGHPGAIYSLFSQETPIS